MSEDRSEPRIRHIKMATAEIGAVAENMPAPVAIMALSRVICAVIATAYPAASRRELLETVIDTLPSVMASLEAYGEVVEPTRGRLQ